MSFVSSQKKGNGLLFRVIIKVKPDQWVDTCFGNSKAGHLYKSGSGGAQPPPVPRFLPSPQVYEVVRPLVRLLDTQRDGLQNYEALLGLTNLSGRSDKLR